MSIMVLLSLIIFLPTVGAVLLLAFDNKAEEPMRYTALATTIATFVLTIGLLQQFNPNEPGIQPVEDGVRGVSVVWIKHWNINYRLGYDGISVPLVLLTSFISVLAMMASWSIKKQVKGYLILFLLLETGMLGVFLALDFFLFYVF